MSGGTRFWRAGALVAALSLGAAGLAEAQDVKSPDAKAPAPKAREANAETRPANVTIVTPWARATPGGAKVGAAFFEIQAKPGLDDKLVGASSPVAATVELHDHVRDGGIVKMRKVDTIAVAAGKPVTLKPGGLHLMLIDLKDALKEGETFVVTLNFEKSGAVKVQVPIQKLGTMNAPAETGSGSGSGSGSGLGSGSGSGSGSTPSR